MLQCVYKGVKKGRDNVDVTLNRRWCNYLSVILLLFLFAIQTPSIAAPNSDVITDYTLIQRPQWRDIGMTDLLPSIISNTIVPPPSTTILHHSLSSPASLSSHSRQMRGTHSLVFAYKYLHIVGGYIYHIGCLRL